MDLSFFTQSKSPNTPLDSFSDADKVKEIQEKICKRRKELEDIVAHASSDSFQEEKLSLLELKKSMGAFGVSEITYQAYLAWQEKNNTTEGKE
jgi:hypothetical protein